MKLKQITNKETGAIQVVTDKGRVLWNVTPENVKQMSALDLVKFTSVLDKCDERIVINKKEQKMRKKQNRSGETQKTPSRNPFSGANDIYLTPNKIAVTRTTTSSAKRGYTKTTKTKYYEQNGANLRKLKAAKGGTVRVGRTGNKYKNL